MNISKLIYEIKENKEKFYLLVSQFEPLIKKYVRLSFKDKEEDTYAELVAALWEAVCNITYYNNDGQITNYFNKALLNKYFELYRNSRKYNDNTIEIGQEKLEVYIDKNNPYESIITSNDMERVKNKLKGRKKQIFELVYLKGLSDLEVAAELNISRQYVHRIKRNLNEMIKNDVLNC
ncbi:MAG: sigma-70 family RNA polymerase sigma factor [Lachnospiraceae bacterium]|nr:sigma-70 family RNA polymerase sigma factor [Lachnospiraceae bacterium]